MLPLLISHPLDNPQESYVDIPHMISTIASDHAASDSCRWRTDNIELQPEARSSTAPIHNVDCPKEPPTSILTWDSSESREVFVGIYPTKVEKLSSITAALDEFMQRV